MSSVELCDIIKNELCGVLNREYQKLRSIQYKGEILWKYILVLIIAIFLATILWIFNIPDIYRQIGYFALIIVSIFLIFQIFMLYTK